MAPSSRSLRGICSKRRRITPPGTRRPRNSSGRNLQWSLTARGEAAISGVLRALDSLRQAVGLQAAVLEVIGDGLLDLADLAGKPRSPTVDARIHVQLRQIENHHTAL